jgi:hypothetical protein
LGQLAIQCAVAALVRMCSALLAGCEGYQGRKASSDNKQKSKHCKKKFEGASRFESGDAHIYEDGRHEKPFKVQGFGAEYVA